MNHQQFVLPKTLYVTRLSTAYTKESTETILTSAKQDIACKQFEIVTIFVIWKERCRRIFTDKEQDIISTVEDNLRKEGLVLNK
jgi:hypothetical protein